MILYNVTTNIEFSVENEWLAWMKKHHIPAVMATELPIGYKIFKLLTELDNGGSTYTVQYFFADSEDFVTYEDQYAPDLRTSVQEHFSGKFVSFRTLLEEVK